VKFRENKEEKKEEVKQAAEVAASAVATEVTWEQTRVILRVIVIILLVAASLWVIYKLEGVLLLLILSIFFAYLVAPLVDLVRRPFTIGGREHTVPRAIAIGIVYLVLFTALGVALWILLPKLSKQIKAFSAASTQFQTTAEGRVKAISDFCRSNELSDNACDALNDGLSKAITAARDYIATDLPNLIGYILSFVPWLVLIPILSFFFLKDVDTFRRSALQMLPRGRWRWRADEFFQDINSTLAAYIRAQLTACLLIGTICTLGFVIIGVPFPLVLGVIAGLFEFIPLVGPLVVAIIATLVTSFSPDTSTYAGVWVLLFLGVLRIVHDYTIYPRLVSQGVHLHPLAVVLAILCGAELAGVAGIFLSIPVTAIATVSYRHWLEHRGSESLVAEILQTSDESEMTPEEEEAAHAAYLGHAHGERHSYPTIDTTADEMTRARPDLTTGELKLPEPD
jgi:predicted PurR-regulated permease PerM